MTGGLHPRVLHKQFGGVVNRPAGIVEPPAQIGLLHRVEERLAVATGLFKRLAADQHGASEECGHWARSGCGAAAEPGNMSGARSALIVDDAHGDGAESFVGSEHVSRVGQQTFGDQLGVIVEKQQERRITVIGAKVAATSDSEVLSRLDRVGIDRGRRHPIPNHDDATRRRIVLSLY